jgi:Zn-dependent alcohol dehydrogenase
LIALQRARRLSVDRLPTRRIKLDEINSGFDWLANGEASRQVTSFLRLG